MGGRRVDVREEREECASEAAGGEEEAEAQQAERGAECAAAPAEGARDGRRVPAERAEEARPICRPAEREESPLARAAQPRRLEPNESTAGGIGPPCRVQQRQTGRGQPHDRAEPEQGERAPAGSVGLAPGLARGEREVWARAFHSGPDVLRRRRVRRWRRWRLAPLALGQGGVVAAAHVAQRALRRAAEPERARAEYDVGERQVCTDELAFVKRGAWMVKGAVSSRGVGGGSLEQPRQRPVGRAPSWE